MEHYWNHIIEEQQGNIQNCSCWADFFLFVGRKCWAQQHEQFFTPNISKLLELELPFLSSPISFVQQKRNTWNRASQMMCPVLL